MKKVSLGKKKSREETPRNFRLSFEDEMIILFSFERGKRVWETNQSGKAFSKKLLWSRNQKDMHVFAPDRLPVCLWIVAGTEAWRRKATGQKRYCPDRLRLCCHAKEDPIWIFREVLKSFIHFWEYSRKRHHWPILSSAISMWEYCFRYVRILRILMQEIPLIRLGTLDTFFFSFK